MMAFLLLVTWLGYAQPPSNYQVEFSSNEVCETARLKLIKDAERIGQYPGGCNILRASFSLSLG